jgi:glycosyltransferase involved in cell wall biosynthesis
MTSLSIIIPAYNEASRIAPTLVSVLEFAALRQEATEVIVVDDGSTDGTAEVCSKVGGAAIQVISLRRNRGKGHAVRTGMLSASGEYRLFTDADGSTPITEFEVLEEALEQAGGSGAAFGSIGTPGAEVARSQAGLRPALGKLGNLLIRGMVLPGVYDSQRGFKVFSTDAATDVFGRSVVDGWGFDVEALVLAKRLGYPIVEVPVRWAHVDGGTLTPAAYLTTLGDVVRIRWNLARGAYDLPPVKARSSALESCQPEEL